MRDAAPVQEPAVWSAGTPPLYPEMKDGEIISAEYHDLTPPAAPVQEPVEYWNAVEGWVKIDEVREHFDSVGCSTIYKTAGENRVPVYTTPPAAQRQWVGLTNKDIIEMWPQTSTVGWDDIRLIEAKLRSKNDLHT
jgi:hypothetical protein